MVNTFTKSVVTGYDDSPPSDDGSQTSSNLVKWATIKTKLPDPLKTAIESQFSNLESVFGDVSLLATTYDDLTATTATDVDSGTVFTLGKNANGDGGDGTWRWDGSSTATANGGTVLQPDAGGTGRWLRLYSGAVSIAWFGASTTASAADNTTAIVAAAAASETVDCPAGAYSITNLSSFPQDVTFRAPNIPLQTATGTDKAGQTSFVLTGSGSGITLAGNGITFENIVFRGNGSTTGITVGSTNFLLFKSCVFQDFSTAGVTQSGGVIITFDKCWWRNNGDHLIGASAFNAINIIDNQFYDTTSGYDIDIGGSPSGSNGVYIAGCRHHGTKAGGFSVKVRSGIEAITIIASRHETANAAGFLQQDDNSFGVSIYGGIFTAPSGTKPTDMFKMAGGDFHLQPEKIYNCTNAFTLDATSRRGKLIYNGMGTGVTNEYVNNSTSPTTMQIIGPDGIKNATFSGTDYEFSTTFNLQDTDSDTANFNVKARSTGASVATLAGYGKRAGSDSGNVGQVAIYNQDGGAQLMSITANLEGATTNTAEINLKAAEAGAFNHGFRLRSNGDFWPIVTESQDIGSPSLEMDNGYWQNAITVSDARLKNEIGTIDNALGFISKLRPVWYSMKDTVIPEREVEETVVEPVLDKAGKQKKDKTGKPEFRTVLEKKTIPEHTIKHGRPGTGFMAQEVKQAMDDSGWDDWKGYRYSEEHDKHMLVDQHFTGVIVQAIKELSDENKKLRQDLDELLRQDLDELK